MTKINDGGSAFPSAFEVRSGAYMPDGRITQQGEMHVRYGMSLRDWFAGQALAGMFNHSGWINTVDDDQTEVSRRAYAMADAMLAASEVQS